MCLNVFVCLHYELYEGMGEILPSLVLMIVPGIGWACKKCLFKKKNNGLGLRRLIQQLCSICIQN